MDLRRLVTDPKPNVQVWVVRWLLRGLAIPYGAVIRIRNWFYDWGWKKTHRSTLPTISVGNLSVGGTGKSPVVSWLATEIRQRNLRVAILSRGYGQLDDGQNDEALELELGHPDVPHLQHWDRVASAKLAEDELEMQVLLLDDAFQHRRIARDLDLVLLDASDSDWATNLLPAGIWREPLSSLRRCQVVMLTRVSQVPQDRLQVIEERVRRAVPGIPILRSNHRPSCLWNNEESLPTETLKDRPVLAFCGIGNPDSFFSSLESMGATIVDRRVFADHHGYTAEDVQELSEWARAHSEAAMVVCTMKDWVKIELDSLGDLPLFALRIELSIERGADELKSLLDQCLARLNDT